MIKKTAGEIVKVLSKINSVTPVSMSFLPTEGGHHGPSALDVPFTLDLVTDAKDNVVRVLFTESHRITLGTDDHIMLDGIGTRHYLQQVHGRTIISDREGKTVLETRDQYAIGSVKPGEGIKSRKDFEAAFLPVFVPKAKKPKESTQVMAVEMLSKGVWLTSTQKSSGAIRVLKQGSKEMHVSDADFTFLWDGDHIEKLFTRENTTTYAATKYPRLDFTRPSHNHLNFVPEFYAKNGMGQWALKEIEPKAIVAAVSEGVKLALAGEAICK